MALWFSLGGRFKCRIIMKRGLTAIHRYCSSVASGKKHVNGVDLYYEQIGRGEHALLFTPGSLGNTQTDFLRQRKLPNQDRFTMVFWDPRGYGRSRPPTRDYPSDFFERDAEDAVGLMKALGFSKFSLLGWSAGGTVALIAAAKNPDLVAKLVVWGASAFFNKEDIGINEAIRDVSRWNEEIRKPLEEVYGLECLSKTWGRYLDATAEFLKRPGGNICQELLPLINCPTLILHGDEDPICPISHAQFIQKHIKGSRLQLRPKGKHNLHVKDAEAFNKLVVDFLEP